MENFKNYESKVYSIEAQQDFKLIINYAISKLCFWIFTNEKKESKLNNSKKKSTEYTNDDETKSNNIYENYF
jgi:hypothetical protein